MKVLYKPHPRAGLITQNFWSAAQLTHTMLQVPIPLLVSAIDIYILVLILTIHQYPNKSIFHNIPTEHNTITYLWAVLPPHTLNNSASDKLKHNAIVVTKKYLLLGYIICNFSMLFKNICCFGKIKMTTRTTKFTAVYLDLVSFWQFLSFIHLKHLIFISQLLCYKWHACICDKCF